MITTTKTNIAYTGDGVTTTYSFDFPAIEPSDIKCYIYDSSNNKTVLIYNIDYTVTLNDNGGTVTLTNPVPSGHILFINREVPYTQETVYEENSPFPAKSHERALDKLTMEIQQVYEKVAAIDSYLGEPASLTKYEFNATDGQTIFNIPDGIHGVVFVYLNGVLLDDGEDYSISNDNITLVQPAESGDVLSVYIFSNFSLQGETYTKADIDSMLAAKANITLDNVNAQTILDKLETVDTDDSGLNANFLQGKDSNQFMQVQYYNDILQNGDLNNAKQPGTFYCDNTNSNLPSDNGGTLLITGNGTNKITQYFMSEDGNFYSRTTTDGTTFTSWSQINQAGGTGIQIVDDRTALRNLVGETGQIVLQKDISVFYRWVTPQQTDNNGTIVNPLNDTTGSWIAIYNGFVYPEWFGAKGDGTTDDTVAIQSAINSEANIIKFKNATYLVSNEITLKSNLVLLGDNSTVKCSDTFPSTSAIFSALSNNDIIIENIVFDGNKANRGDVDEALLKIVTSQDVYIQKCTIQNNGYMGIALAGCNKVRVKNCNFYNTGKSAATSEGGAAIWTGDYSTTHSYGVIIENNYFNDLEWSAIYLNANNSKVLGNRITNTHESSIYSNTTTAYNVFSGNHISGTVKKNISASGIECGSSYSVISNNHIDTVGDSCISLTDIRSIVVSGNELNNARQDSASFPQGSLIQILSVNAQAYMNSIVGNNLYQITGSCYAPINIANDGGGLADYLTIIGNNIHGVFDTTALDNKTTNRVIENNTVYDDFPNNEIILKNSKWLKGLDTNNNGQYLINIDSLNNINIGSSAPGQIIIGYAAAQYNPVNIKVGGDNHTVVKDYATNLLVADSVSGYALGLSGYKKLAGGLIIQWTTVYCSSTGVAVTWTYPIPFPNARILVLTNATGKYAHTYAMNETTTSADIVADQDDTYVRCVALGY